MTGHQSPENQAGEIAFRRVAAFGEPEKRLEDAREKLAWRRQIFRELHARGVPLGPFVEIGADIGHTAIMLRNEFDVDGAASDISWHALKTAAEVRARLDYTLLPLRICCDARWLPFVDGALGFVYCFETLHHFADPEPVVREAERVLRDGGAFYFAEEPVRRWLCLNLYRCYRAETLTGINRWLFELGLLRFVAEAYVGSRLETEWGLVENQMVSLARWERYLSVFDSVELDLSQLYAPEGRLARRAMAAARLPARRADRVAANLFGVSLRGLCRARKSAAPPAPGTDLRRLCRCPDCQKALRWETRPAPHFECAGCGPFPEIDGVHMLFRREQLRALYPVLPESAASVEAREREERMRQAVRDGRCPYDLIEGAVITSVRLVDGVGNPVAAVRSGEDTAVEVSAAFSDGVTDPIVGMTIRRRLYGEPTIVYETNTRMRGQVTGAFGPGGSARIAFRQPMSLGPGAYTISVAVASADGARFYDWREAVLPFDVVGGEDMHGIANLHSKVEVGPRPR